VEPLEVDVSSVGSERLQIMREMGVSSPPAPNESGVILWNVDEDELGVEIRQAIGALCGLGPLVISQDTATKHTK